MKSAPILLAAFVLAGCSGEGSPLAPTRPGVTSSATQTTSARAFLWVMVVEGSGQCIEGATVDLRHGLEPSQSIAQVTPCDVWAAGGGAMFTNLVPGVEMTVRSSAPGYAPQEKTVTTTLGSQMAIILAPSKI
jgi:hypothetical protein